MEAITFTGKTNKLLYCKLPIPVISEPNQVLIKVAYAGVCGTDVHIISGEFPCNDGTVVLGHEFSGTVIDIGKNVKNVAINDRVAVDPNEGCRCCNFCHAGNPHYCNTGGIENTIGIHRNGGWGTYALVPCNTVEKLPELINFQQGALAEPISCLSHGWDMLSPVSVGSRILVIGAGIIGNLWVSLLHLQGHRRVTVSEPNRNRLELTRNLDTNFNLITPDELTKNHQADPNYLFDVVIDCSGYCPAIEQGLNLLDKGGKLCCFDIGPPGATFKVSSFHIYYKEITIFGVNTNPYSFTKSIGFLDALGTRYLDYKKLGIQVFALADYQNAFNALKSGKISKAVFKLNE